MAGEDDASTTKQAAAAAAHQEAAVVVGSKRKAEDAKVDDERQAAAAGGGDDDGETLVLAPGEIYVDPATGIKWVDMPEDYLGWVLSQKRMPSPKYDQRKFTMLSPEAIEREVASVKKLDALLAGVKDEFFSFQAWVRETYETRGRVLVPEDSIPDAFTVSEPSE